MLAVALPDRMCEGVGCGNRIQPGVPRRRNEDGKLLCPACAQGRPSGVFAEAGQSTNPLVRCTHCRHFTRRRHEGKPVCGDCYNSKTGARGMHPVYTLHSMDPDENGEFLVMHPGGGTRMSLDKIKRLLADGHRVDPPKKVESLMRRHAEREEGAAADKPCDNYVPDGDNKSTCGNCYWAIGAHSAKALGVPESPTSVQDYLRKHQRRVVAHDSGDGFTIAHCPFCGSGMVVARGDGSAECAHCSQVFTVQVQPYFPGLPQTDPNVPLMGGDHPPPGVDPEPPADEVEEKPKEESGAGSAENKGGNAMASLSTGKVCTKCGQPIEPGEDFGSTPGTATTPAYVWHYKCPEKKTSRRYVTASGLALDYDAYLFRLALEHGEDRVAVLAARTASSQDNCPVCGRRITDFDDNGTERDDGQRWCRDHFDEFERGHIDTSKIAGIMDYYDVVVHRKGDEGAVVEHETADLQDAIAHAKVHHTDPQVARVHVINRGNGSVFWSNGQAQPGGRFTSARADDKQWSLLGGDWQGAPRYRVHFATARPEWEAKLPAALDAYKKRGRKLLHEPKPCDSGEHQGPCTVVTVEGRDNANALHGISSAIGPPVSYEKLDPSW